MVTADDGVKLYYEEAGTGDPILFLHEFGGHHLSWEPQVRYFSRRYRCIAYAARGWPPSDIPASADAYSQERAADDAAAVLQGLGIAKAHVVGLSMGATAAIEFGIRHPQMALSLTAAAAGSGASTDPAAKRKFQEECASFAARIEREGMPAMAELYCAGPARVQYRDKDPRGWARVQAPVRRGLGQGPRAHHDRRPEPTRAAIRAQGGACRDPGAGAHRRRRRGRHHPRPGAVPEADDPALRPVDAGQRPATASTSRSPQSSTPLVENFIHAVERDRWGISATVAGKSYTLVPREKQA